MIPVKFWMTLVDRVTWTRYYASRTVQLPAVPRVGDDVEVTPGGWSEQVRAVTWVLDGAGAHLSLGPAAPDVEFDPATEDLRAIAAAAGWDVT